MSNKYVWFGLNSKTLNSKKVIKQNKILNNIKENYD